MSIFTATPRPIFDALSLRPPGPAIRRRIPAQKPGSVRRL